MSKGLINAGSGKATQTIPFLVWLGLLMAVFGFLFPIYGIPVSVFKLTFWRAGVVLLLPLALFYNPRLRMGRAKITGILFLFALLAIWRLLSLVFLAPDRSFGSQQLTWFVEGWAVLAIVALLQAHLKWFLTSFYGLCSTLDWSPSRFWQFSSFSSNSIEPGLCHCQLPVSGSHKSN